MRWCFRGSSKLAAATQAEDLDSCLRFPVGGLEFGVFIVGLSFQGSSENMSPKRFRGWSLRVGCVA